MNGGPGGVDQGGTSFWTRAIHWEVVAPQDRDRYRPLMHEADEWPAHLESYLYRGVLIAAHEGGVPVGTVLAVVGDDEANAEVMNVAVVGRHRRRGLGTLLMERMEREMEQREVRRLAVGTGNSSFGPLAFYQRLGYRIVGVRRDYFRDAPPMWEDGIRVLDMVLLEKDLPSAP